MLAAVYYSNKDIRIQEFPKPKINDNEILLKVISSGICGSDVLEWYRIKQAPRVLGHEAAGDIVEAGKNVKNYKVGDRIFVSHHVPCNTCDYCLKGHHTACHTLHTTNFDPGGFAEFIRIPEINVDRGILKLPESVDYDEGTFIEPLGCVIRGQRIANIKAGDSVLVIGSGISGLLHIQLAKISGASKIFAADISYYRLNAAKKFGADFTIDAKNSIAEELKKSNNGKLADVVILCTGAIEAVNQAAQCVEKGGAILFFAVPKPGIDVTIPISDFWRNEIKILTSYGAAPADLKTSLDLISSKKINVKIMITHKLPLTEAQKGFQLVAEAKESIKVILEPN